MASLFGQGLPPGDGGSHSNLLPGSVVNANAWDGSNVAPDTPSEVQPGSLASLLDQQQPPTVGPGGPVASPRSINALS